MLLMQKWMFLVGAAAVQDKYKLWPKPESFAIHSETECSLRDSFRFIAANAQDSGAGMPHLQRLLSAIQTDNDIMTALFTEYPIASSQPCGITECHVHVAHPEEGMNDDIVSESYSISFKADTGCEITCRTSYGCMRGITSFLQLINPVRDFNVPVSFDITDKPEFVHRGLLIDTSRHFIPKDMIEEHIKLMAATKLNVLHWHIVDDHSFPLEVESFPLLAQKGAYSGSTTYSRQDIRDIVDLASSYGIRVIPEIDVPGHTTSWMRGYPELLGIAKTAIDPTREENYAFIKTLLAEVKDMFSSDVYEGRMVIHLGGDETWDGWDTEAIRDWMRAHGMTSNTDLIRYWMRRLSGIAEELSISIVIWEDFLEVTGDDITEFGDSSNHVAFQTWRRNYPSSIELAGKINRNVIFSSDFYLDHLQLTWMDLYKVNMYAHPGILGGEACMWGEWVDKTNMLQRVWPRAAAVAERLWCGSRCPLDASKDAVVRLARWRCRMMNFFGFSSIEPVGNAYVESPDVEWIYHSDREQWYCDEVRDVNPVNLKAKVYDLGTSQSVVAKKYIVK